MQNQEDKPQEKQKPQQEQKSQEEQKPQEKQKPQEEQKSEVASQQTLPPSAGSRKASPEVTPRGKKARPKECAVCNKSVKKRWYYREGNYYCGKGCWKKSKKGKEKGGAKSEKTK